MGLLMSGQGMAIPQPRSVAIRVAKPEDATAAGKVCYEAVRPINADPSFPPDFPNVEAAVAVLSMAFSNPHFYCVVAESDGRIVGSNCLDERGAIAGVGPITVDPGFQNGGLGRSLMDAVLRRACERRCAGIRLIQAAFHNRSLPLYAKLGFVVREPVDKAQFRIQREGSVVESSLNQSDAGTPPFTRSPQHCIHQATSETTILESGVDGNRPDSRDCTSLIQAVASYDPPVRLCDHTVEVRIRKRHRKHGHRCFDVREIRRKRVVRVDLAKRLIANP